MKNAGRRLLDIEDAARVDLDVLLSLWHRRTKLNVQPFKSLRQRWGFTGWRRRSRRLIARLWIEISDMEMLVRQWAERRYYLERGVEEGNKVVLLQRDYANDVRAIESLNLSLIQSAVEQASQRLDNRATAVATAYGALAGGIAGVIAALLSGG
jgi:hypothetical protein